MLRSRSAGRTEHVEAFLDAAATPDRDDLATAAKAEAEETFQRKIAYLADFGRRIAIPDVDVQVLSQVMLTVLDEKWKDHLYDLDQLRNAIQYRAYGQKDPLVEYKKEAFEMFQDLMGDIQSTFTERPEDSGDRRGSAAATGAAAGSAPARDAWGGRSLHGCAATIGRAVAQPGRAAGGVELAGPARRCGGSGGGSRAEPSLPLRVGE